MKLKILKGTSQRWIFVGFKATWNCNNCHTYSMHTAHYDIMQPTIRRSLLTFSLCWMLTWDDKAVFWEAFRSPQTAWVTRQTAVHKTPQWSLKHAVKPGLGIARILIKGLRKILLWTRSRSRANGDTLASLSRSIPKGVRTTSAAEKDQVLYTTPWT